jgi:hypothetical protein
MGLSHYDYFDQNIPIFSRPVNHIRNDAQMILWSVPKIPLQVLGAPSARELLL